MFSTEELIFYTVYKMGFKYNRIYMDYSIKGDYYDKLVTTRTEINNDGIEEDIIIKPDKDAFNNAFYENFIDQKRILRNKYLTDSDKFSLPDYPHKSDDMRQSWLNYRKELRNFTIKIRELLDQYGFEVEIKWPIPPE